MDDLSTDYTVFYRWQWFSRERWQGIFRERKRHSSGGFVELVRERGLAGEKVLDCSCGLGLKTIVIREAGLDVEGSDGCRFAVEHARQLAAEEGHGDLRFFQATWAGLPQATDRRYAAVFNDALSWVYSEQEMAASLRGLHDVLRPGGLLAYMGAPPGSAEHTPDLLEQQWQKMLAECGRYHLGFRHTDGTTTATELLVQEKGPDCVDRHHLYLVEERGKEPRLEAMTMRHVVKWHWPKMEPFLREAGFCEFATHDFVAANGRPFPLVVASRG
jgi:SAM-dependent methyltransferase